MTEELVSALREGVDGDPNIGLAPANDTMREAADRIEALQADKAKLRKVVEASEGLKRDLLHRAKWDDDAKVVCAGTSAWLRFTEALEALDKQP